MKVRKNKKTTEQYKQELEELNKLNNTNIKLKDGIEYDGADTKIIHICSCGKEWLVIPSSILSHRSKTCGLCYTFAEWGIDNLGENFLEKYWDYEKNNKLEINPWKIGCGSEKTIYIFCQTVNYHGSYPTMSIHFTKGHRCSYCANRKVHKQDSFGQFLIESFGHNALELYWDYNKNKKDPFTIAKQTDKKVYIKCQEKNYHDSYKISPAHFVNGRRCPYCNPRKYKVHILDSLGTLHPESLKVWSDKNKQSPYEYTPNSGKDVWWKCSKGIHDDYPRSISSSKRFYFICPECSRQVLESNMASILKQVFKYEYPDTIWEYDAGFRTNKNGISKYDIYIPRLHLLIECQSVYHDDEESKIRDKLKKEFAITNNYKYMELDNRNYSPLEAIQIFFPYIKEIPDYIDLNTNTLRNWDIKEAQKLLNQGKTFKDVANMIGTTYIAIYKAYYHKLLIIPNDYISGNKEVVCLTKDDNLVNTYKSVTEAAKDFGKKNGTSISSSLTKTPNKKGKIKEMAYGFKWMYLEDYEKMLKEKEKEESYK